MKKDNNFNIGDRIKIKDSGGQIWLGTIANINHYRKPSMEYAIDLDEYPEDIVFFGLWQLEKVED